MWFITDIIYIWEKLQKLYTVFILPHGQVLIWPFSQWTSWGCRNDIYHIIKLYLRGTNNNPTLNILLKKYFRAKNTMGVFYVF